MWLKNTCLQDQIKNLDFQLIHFDAAVHFGTVIKGAEALNSNIATKRLTSQL